MGSIEAIEAPLNFIQNEVNFKIATTDARTKIFKGVMDLSMTKMHGDWHFEDDEEQKSPFWLQLQPLKGKMLKKLDPAYMGGANIEVNLAEKVIRHLKDSSVRI